MQVVLSGGYCYLSGSFFRNYAGNLTISIAIMQLQVSAALMQVTFSAPYMWMTIFIVIMQMEVSVVIMQVVFSAVHYAHDYFYCMQVTVSSKY